MRRLVLPLLLLAAPACALAADDDGVTPYRPSVSSPAQLPRAGQLELELGGLATKTGEARRDSLPYLFKLAFDKEWGVLVGGEAFVSARDPSGSARGLGDTTVTLKRAFLVDDATGFGLELGAKLPTARDAIGSGARDYTLNGIASRDLGALHVDANLNLTHVGGTEPGTSSRQLGASVALSAPLGERWGVNWEVLGTRRAGTPSTAQMLAAVTWTPRRDLAFDAGVVRGLNGASQDWSLFAGMVVPLGRLW